MADVPEEEPKLNGTEPPPATVVRLVKEDEDVSHSPTKYHRGNSDPDAQEMVISSLRTQVQDLFSQVSQLNNKLVNSYDRVSDLEDELHVTSAGLRNSSLKISQLELERTQHLSALNTGLLVEKSHVTTELNRLMEKATEEAAQRGQAESARMAIEKELEDLSAALFGQANTMVAEARYEKYLSERKVEEAEKTLKGAEEAVQLMQTQMQALHADKEEAEGKVEDMEALMGKGKWVERTDTNTPIPTRFLSTHTAYQDYLAFVAHLRVLRPTSPQPPAMSTLLPLPFLARLLNEDSEPTVRLDLAPSLNWLSRRSVLAAIHSGQLTIEPVSAPSLFAETNTHPAPTTIAGMNSSGDNISCALCGTSIFPTPDHSHPSRSQTVSFGGAYGHPASWSGSFFKKSASLGSNLNSQPGTPARPSVTTSIGSQLNAQVFIFRLESAPSSAISALPIPSLTKSSSQTSSSVVPQQSGSYLGGSAPSYNGSPSNQPATIYLLCTSGWCLSRLRTTCTLWAFIRTGLVDKIWEEDVALPPPVPTVPTHVNGEKPPVPPRKRGIWGIASAIGEKAASWSDNDKDKKKALPPPPHHPSGKRRIPPPLSPVSDPSQQASSRPASADVPVEPSAPPPLPKRASTPPPLPKRNEGRSRNPNPSPPPRTSTDTPPPAYSQEVTLPANPAKRLSLDPTVPLSSVRGSHLQPEPARAQSPSNVPLPDSRPATPPVLPARAVPPAVSGAPPPLPRRAAARVRVPLGDSRSSTPGNAGETPPVEMSASTETTDKAPTEKVGEHATDNAEISKSTENNTDAPAVPIIIEGQSEDKSVSETEKGVEALPDRSTQDSPGSDDFVDAPTPGDSDLSVAASVAREPTEKAGGGVLEERVKPDVEDSKAQESDGDSQLTEGPRQINGDDPSHPSELNGIVESQVEDGPAKPEPKTKMGERSMEGCVGDGTWEERTWKEIVKLREDMFWARIGALRD